MQISKSKTNGCWYVTDIILSQNRMVRFDGKEKLAVFKLLEPAIVGGEIPSKAGFCGTGERIQHWQSIYSSCEKFALDTETTLRTLKQARIELPVTDGVFGYENGTCVRIA